MFVAVDYNSLLMKIVTSESQGTSHFKASNQPVYSTYMWLLIFICYGS